jgi:DNA-binding CsgD family transcriptional regulator/type II secretory pathway predicted ATPase ExeA
MKDVGEWAAHRVGLVGRKAELGAAGAALRTGSGGVVLVGDPGVGKTRLARAVLAQYRQRGDHEILWVVASASGPSIPFGAFAPLVPDVGGRPGQQPGPFTLLQTIRKAVMDRAGGRQLLIGVDDAHRIDGQSATLLFQLVAFEGAKTVVVVQSGHTQVEAIRALWKEGLVERIDVDPLGQDDTLELASRLLGTGSDSGEPDETRSERLQLGVDLADALWRISGGNPLYLRELVTVGRHLGRIVLEDERWRLHGDLQMGPRLGELIQERLGRIGDRELAALEVVAFADPVPLAVLTRLVSLEQISALYRKGLLRIERSHGEQQVRSCHPIYSEAVRAEIPATRASELGLQLADAFEADGRMDHHILRIVAWRLEAGAEPGTEVLLDASNRAAERNDWEMSRRLAAAAVSADGGSEAACALADALRALGRYSEALEVLGNHQGEGDDQVARMAVLRAFILASGLGRYDEADAALARADARIADVSLQAWVQAIRAGLLTFSGRPLETVVRAKRLLQRGGLRPRSAVAVRAALATGLSWSGRVDQAVWTADSCQDEAYAGAGERLSISWAQLARAVSYLHAGRVGEMEKRAQAQHQLAVQLNDRYGQGAAAAALGCVALPRGQITAAISRFREAIAALESADPLGTRMHAMCGLIEALALSGDAGGAAAVLAEAQRTADNGGWGELRLAVPAAWVTAAQGDVGRALKELRVAGEQARSKDLLSFELTAWASATRLGSAEVAAEAADLAQRMEGPLAGIVAAHAAALAAGGGAGEALDEVAERYDSMTLYLYAAESSAQASQSHARAGLPRRAASSAARAHDFLADHSGPRLLGLALALAPPELTRREQEVAMLAISGLSSRVIANRLCLSVRTIDSHLARVYSKMGITGRSDLAKALTPVLEGAEAG